MAVGRGRKFNPNFEILGKISKLSIELGKSFQENFQSGLTTLFFVFSSTCFITKVFN